MLLSRQLKRKARTLAPLALWILLMRAIDIIWHVEPVSHPTFHISWLHITVVAGIGGLWLAYFCHNLKSRPLLAVNAPQTLRLFEERSHH